MIVIVGNKSDMTDERAVGKFQEQADKDSSCPYYECSAKSGEGVKESFDRIIEMACNPSDALGTAPKEPGNAAATGFVESN